MSMPDVGRYLYAIGPSTPTIYNVNIAAVDTEYELALPTQTRFIRFQARQANAFRYAFQEGVVAGPVGNYMILKAGDVYQHTAILTGAPNDDVTIYFAKGAAVQLVVEVEVWT